MAWKAPASAVWVSLLALAYLELSLASLAFAGGQESDPLNKFNEIMEDMLQEEAVGLAENVNKAKEILRALEVKEALKLYSELPTNEGDICEPKNLHTLKNLFSLADGHEASERSLKSPNTRRLVFRHIGDLARAAKARCFLKLESSWQKLKPKMIPVMQPIKIPDYYNHRTDFPQLLEKHEYESHMYESIRCFNGAVEFLKKGLTGDSFSGSDLREVLRKIHKEATHEEQLQVDEKTGQPVPLTTERALQLVKTYLIEPCSSLVEHKEEVKILETAILLGHSVKPDDWIRMNMVQFEVSFWAARYVVCKQLLQMEPDQLAKKVASGWI